MGVGGGGGEVLKRNTDGGDRRKVLWVKKCGLVLHWLLKSKTTTIRARICIINLQGKLWYKFVTLHNNFTVSKKSLKMLCHG